MTVKAFHCFSSDDWDGDHLLVFADTPGKAKLLALHNGTCDYDGFLAIKCRRAPAWDGMTSTPMVIDDNEDIAYGYPDFYGDEEATP